MNLKRFSTNTRWRIRSYVEGMRGSVQAPNVSAEDGPRKTKTISRGRGNCEEERSKGRKMMRWGVRREAWGVESKDLPRNFCRCGRWNRTVRSRSGWADRGCRNGRGARVGRGRLALRGVSGKRCRPGRRPAVERSRPRVRNSGASGVRAAGYACAGVLSRRGRTPRLCAILASNKGTDE